MFSNVIVGVDGHLGGHDAIALAARLVEPSGQLSLAHVGAGPTRKSDPAADASKRELLKLLDRARMDAEVDGRLIVIRAPTPGAGLHRTAEHMQADLLVIGSSRRGLLGRVLLGDDTHAALNGAPCSVAIAPTRYASQHGSIRKICVGYSGSVQSKHAVAVGRQLASRYDAKLSALEAVELPAIASWGLMAGGADVIDDVIADAQQEVSALHGVEPHVSYGDAAEQLARYSASVDLLILGSRTRGPVGRLIHRNTSGRLAHSARCPLLVVTREPPSVEDLDAAAARPSTGLR